MSIQTELKVLDDKTEALAKKLGLEAHDLEAALSKEAVAAYHAILDRFHARADSEAEVLKNEFLDAAKSAADSLDKQVDKEVAKVEKVTEEHPPGPTVAT